MFMMLCHQNWTPQSRVGYLYVTCQVCKSRCCGVSAFVTMCVPVVSHNSVTLYLPFHGSCMGVCILSVTLSLGVCMCDCLLRHLGVRGDECV